MPGITSTSTGNFSVQFQNYFSKLLLKKLVPKLQLAPFAQKADLPKSAGALTVRFFRFAPPQTTNIATLTEGTAISSANYRQLALQNVDVPLVQYGQVISLTDILQNQQIFNLVEQSIETQAMDAALHADTLIRNELGSNIASLPADHLIYAEGLTTYAATAAATAPAGTLHGIDILDSVTTLKKDNAPMINGKYIGVFGPQVTRDLMRDAGTVSTFGATWFNASQYSAVDQIFNGEIGSLYGCRILETTNPWRATTQYTYLVSGTVHTGFMFGDQAFGVPNLASMSPFGPKVSIVDGADKSDPLNQQTLVGFKTMYAAKTLQPSSICQLYSKPTIQT